MWTEREHRWQQGAPLVRDFRWIDPEFVSLVAAHRLDALEGRVEPDVTEGLITVQDCEVVKYVHAPKE